MDAFLAISKSHRSRRGKPSVTSAPVKRKATEKIQKVSDDAPPELLVVRKRKKEAVVVDLVPESDEIVALQQEVARLKKEHASLRRGLAQSKRERVYHLPGGKQLFKWVEGCSNYDAIFSDIAGRVNRRSYVRTMLERLCEGAAIHLAQTGGDPDTFYLVVTLAGVERTETYIADEWNCDNPFEYGKEQEVELEPYQLRVVMGKGMSLQLPGMPSTRSRYVWAKEDKHAYIAPADDEQPVDNDDDDDDDEQGARYSGVFTITSKEEFRIADERLLHLVIAHSLQFLPKKTRERYLKTVHDTSILGHCLDTCGCFQELRPE